MNPVLLARLQFGIVTVYHFFFVPLTLGLSITVAIMETLYVIKGDEVYRRMTKFWGKLFLINFAMGLVTGIVQEFQFGMNWSEYSRFVGDIFGAPLAIEALLAFFLESTFLGVWIFGWDKLSKKIHLTTIWLVAIGANLSALWILAANSFMQSPVGYTLRNGRAEMTDFFALLKNPNLSIQFLHVTTAGLVTAAFFVLGISAYHLVKKNYPDLFMRSFKIAAIIGSIAIIVTTYVGHDQMLHVMEIQPMKAAAAETLWHTETLASFSILTITDLSQRKDIVSIRVPGGLCLIAYGNLNCTVEGIYELQQKFVEQYGPGDYIPPVSVIYWSFRVMVGAGTLMLFLVLYGLYLAFKKTAKTLPRWLPIFTWAIVMPYLANSSGWIMTEMGRIPWIVYGLMKVQDGISNTVPSAFVLTSLLVYTLIYGGLMVAAIYLFFKYGKAGPSENEKPLESNDDQAPSLVGAQD